MVLGFSARPLRSAGKEVSQQPEREPKSFWQALLSEDVPESSFPPWRGLVFSNLHVGPANPLRDGRGIW
jgi:hypothetical protein